ncbi:MAG: anti-sigma factor family protein [Thermoguttaceae bacterium]
MEKDPIQAEQTEGPPSLDEELVAYLDGELDDQASRRVEELLTSDSSLRERLGRLERTWDALDKLDRSEVDEEFTRTTIEMLALVAEKEWQDEEEERPLRQRRRLLFGSAGLLTACVGGFLAVWSFWPDPNQELLNDLPVLERLDEYRQIDDIGFLKLLHEEQLFPQENKDDGA